MGNQIHLQDAMKQVPSQGARIVREVAQKEVEADVRAHEALMSRAMALLAATGVAAGLLLRSGEGTRATGLWYAAIVFGGITMVALLGSILVRGFDCLMANGNIIGTKVPATDESEWLWDYERALALAYLELRENLRKRHQSRATFLLVAQVAFFVFVGLVLALAATRLGVQ